MRAVGFDQNFHCCPASSRGFSVEAWAEVVGLHGFCALCNNGCGFQHQPFVPRPRTEAACILPSPTRRGTAVDEQFSPAFHLYCVCASHGPDWAHSFSRGRSKLAKGSPPQDVGHRQCSCSWRRRRGMRFHFSIYGPSAMSRWNRPTTCVRCVSYALGQGPVAWFEAARHASGGI